MGAKSDKIADVIQQIKFNVPEGKAEGICCWKAQKNPADRSRPRSDHANMVDKAGADRIKFRPAK